MAANQNSEAAKKRKARKANVTSSELAMLAEQVDENVHVLKSKFTDSVTNAKKNEILGRNNSNSECMQLQWKRGRPQKSGINGKL